MALSFLPPILTLNLPTDRAAKLTKTGGNSPPRTERPDGRTPALWANLPASFGSQRLLIDSTQTPPRSISSPPLLRDVGMSERQSRRPSS